MNHGFLLRSMLGLLIAAPAAAVEQDDAAVSFSRSVIVDAPAEIVAQRAWATLATGTEGLKLVAEREGTFVGSVTVPFAPDLSHADDAVRGTLTLSVVVDVVDGGADVRVAQVRHRADGEGRLVHLGTLSNADDPGAEVCGPDTVRHSGACTRGHMDVCVTATCDADWRVEAWKAAQAEAARHASAVLDAVAARLGGR